MKKTLFVALLFISIGLHAQESTPIIIQSDAYSVLDYNDQKDDWEEWTEWIKLESPIIVKIYTQDDLITINNKAEDKFKILDSEEVTEGTDSDGDGFKNFIFNAIDKEGNFLDVRVKWFDSGTIHVYCEYQRRIYVYTGEQLTF